MDKSWVDKISGESKWFRASQLEKEGKLEEALSLYLEEAEEKAGESPGLSALSMLSAAKCATKLGRHEEARKYFFLTKVTVPPGGRLEMPDDRGFYCAVTTKGEGEIKGPFGEFPIKRGKSVFITATLPGYDFVNTGDRTLEVICCYPPPAD